MARVWTLKIAMTLYPPHRHHQPKLRQWVALHHRLFYRHATPYAAFAVWLPYDGVLERELNTAS